MVDQMEMDERNCSTLRIHLHSAIFKGQHVVYQRCNNTKDGESLNKIEVIDFMYP